MANLNFSLIFLIIVVSEVYSKYINKRYTERGCSIDIKKSFTEKHPLLLEQQLNNFILPLNGIIELYEGQQIRLSCPGNNNRFLVTYAQEISITCVQSQSFIIDNNSTNITNFINLQCLNYPESTARQTGNKCSLKYTEIEIGFNTNIGFVPVMMSCFDEVKQDSLYTMFNLSSHIKHKQSASRPKDFRSKFYNIHPSTLYKRRNQFNRFENILQSKQLSQKYISNVTQFFLARGHLTAKSDFIYGSQQRATFYYFNAAPQWQIINGKNWFTLEWNCRNYASTKKLNLKVYTGIFGSAKLPDKYGNLQELSLHSDENNNNLLTVPELFWKLVYYPVLKNATIFITHNNPYAKRVYKICTDVCYKIKWLRWKPQNITAGFSYCCEYEDVKKVINYIPDIVVHNLLV